jgi:peptide/nickel transport system permease protein
VTDVATAVPAGGPRVNPLVGFMARRFGRFVVSCFFLVTATFLMIHAIPGDPVRSAVGLTATPEVVAAQRARFHLDDPLGEQYLRYVGGVATGDLGESIVQRRSVLDEIRDRLPASLKLGGLAFLVTILIGIPTGATIAVLSHRGRGRAGELAFSMGTGILTVIPQFLMGVGLVFVFSVTFDLLPVAGRAGASSYVLPVLALALGPTALLARVVRVETHRVLDENFVQTARAKRLPPMSIYLRHVLPNAMAATLTVAGAILGSLIAGTVLIENVFAWPGLGTTLVESITGKDYAMAQGLALVFGAAVLIINMGVDLVLAVFDPRSTMVGS